MTTTTPTASAKERVGATWPALKCCGCFQPLGALHDSCCYYAPLGEFQSRVQCEHCPVDAREPAGDAERQNAEFLRRYAPRDAEDAQCMSSDDVSQWPAAKRLGALGDGEER
ncbi:MAG TPA: hypothetical protein VFT98_16185 [Myxococcota bacterium]|nr:hypothetical protein [Myxococcota bacterium]